MRTRAAQRRRQGMTLIEIILVVVIIALGQWVQGTYGDFKTEIGA